MNSDSGPGEFLNGDLDYQEAHKNDTTNTEPLFQPNVDPREVFADLIQVPGCENLRPLRLDNSEKIGGFTAYEVSRTSGKLGSVDYVYVPVGQAIVEFRTTTNPLYRYCYIHFPKAVPGACISVDRMQGDLTKKVAQSEGGDPACYELKGAVGKLSHSTSKAELISFQEAIVSEVAQQNMRRQPQIDYPSSLLLHVSERIQEINDQDNNAIWDKREPDKE